jgi:hypothetical protein
MSGNLREYKYTFLIIFLLSIRNASDKSCRESKKNAFYDQYFFFENHAVFEIMWKNIVVLGKLQMKI